MGIRPGGGGSAWWVVATQVFLLAPDASGRHEASLEDTLSHLDYARLFDTFHSWSHRYSRQYPNAVAERAALTAFYEVRPSSPMPPWARATTHACMALAESHRRGGVQSKGRADGVSVPGERLVRRDVGRVPRHAIAGVWRFRCALSEHGVAPKGGRPRRRGTRRSGLARKRRRHDDQEPGAGICRQAGAVDALSATRPSLSLQGMCGASWAFAAIGAVEGMHAIMTGSYVELSEQMLISCDHGHATKAKHDEGCHGGLPENGFGWIHMNGGVSMDRAYGRYTSGMTGSDGECTCCSERLGLCTEERHVCSRDVTCGGYFRVPNDETVLLDAVAQQPVAVGVDASPHTFMVYASGVYDDPTRHGSSKLNHAMLVVGYGSLDGVPYWKVPPAIPATRPAACGAHRLPRTSPPRGVRSSKTRGVRRGGMAATCSSDGASAL